MKFRAKSLYCNFWLAFLEKTEKHQENEVNDEEFNWNNVKRGNLNIDQIICRWAINLTTLS
jgi:hypothetical protein